MKWFEGEMVAFDLSAGEQGFPDSVSKQTCSQSRITSEFDPIRTCSVAHPMYLLQSVDDNHGIFQSLPPFRVSSRGPCSFNRRSDRQAGHASARICPRGSSSCSSVAEEDQHSPVVELLKAASDFGYTPGRRQTIGSEQQVAS